MVFKLKSCPVQDNNITALTEQPVTVNSRDAFIGEDAAIKMKQVKGSWRLF